MTCPECAKTEAELLSSIEQQAQMHQELATLRSVASEFVDAFDAWASGDRGPRLKESIKPLRAALREGEG